MQLNINVIWYVNHQSGKGIQTVLFTIKYTGVLIDNYSYFAKGLNLNQVKEFVIDIVDIYHDVEAGCAEVIRYALSKEWCKDRDRWCVWFISVGKRLLASMVYQSIW